jgi:hypothetical protein
MKFATAAAARAGGSSRRTGFFLKQAAIIMIMDMQKGVVSIIENLQTKNSGKRWLKIAGGCHGIKK